MLISFEGVDGVGKSAAVQEFAKFLESTGEPPLLLSDPGGTPLGESLRRSILRYDAEPVTEALLFAAARAEAAKKRVLPAIREGRIVVADRWKDSSLAYQGAGRGVPERFLQAINAGAPTPDLTFLLDAPPSVAAARRRDRDRIERRPVAFFARVREEYLRLAAQHPRFIVLDAASDMARVSTDVRDAFLKRRAAGVNKSE